MRNNNKTRYLTYKCGRVIFRNGSVFLYNIYFVCVLKFVASALNLVQRILHLLRQQ